MKLAKLIRGFIGGYIIGILATLPVSIIVIGLAENPDGELTAQGRIAAFALVFHIISIGLLVIVPEVVYTRRMEKEFRQQHPYARLSGD